MKLDPVRLRTLRQFAEEAPVFTVPYLRWLITNARTNGFDECFVRVSGRVFIDPQAVTAWLARQQTNPLPHGRGIARKRLSKAYQDAQLVTA
jgi:hypothetical protein